MPVSREQGPGWLRDFGLVPENLPEDLQQLAEKLGRRGVRKLVQNARGQIPYRGELINEDERTETLLLKLAKTKDKN